MDNHTQAVRPVMRRAVPGLVVCLALAAPLCAQQEPLVTARNDSITVHFVDTDLSAAVQALGRQLDRPLGFGALGDGRVTLETPEPVPRSDAAALLRGMLASHDYELVADSDMYRIRKLAGTGGEARQKNGPGSQASGVVRLWVIRLHHARAADVAATVNALYGRASALGELGRKPQTLSEALKAQRVPPTGVPQDSEKPLAAGRSATFTGDVTIVPDAGTNSLLVRASEQDFGLVKAAVEQLDIRPLQVLIEVLIAEVRRDRSFSLGVALDLDTTQVSAVTGTKVTGSNAGLGLGDFVMHVMHIGTLKLDATLEAAAGRGDVAILSRPVLLTANNEPADIMVGSQRPFVQVSRSLPTDAPSRDQVVQYKDVGTKLSIHPTISDDGYVMLDVSQEISAATTETAFNAPVISTRSIQTRLLVKDGQTVVLGGLSDKQRDNNKAGIPVLSSIPLIGGLFGAVNHHSTRTELLLFLTPRVIRSDEDLDKLTGPLKKQAQKVKP